MEKDTFDIKEIIILSVLGLLGILSLGLLVLI
jgi:hypothetical protein